MKELILCICGFPLREFSEVVEIITPIVLLIWFWYSQNQIHSKIYYEEIIGLYAGYYKPTIISTENKSMLAGMILNIKNVDSNGYFKGQFEYAEVQRYLVNEIPQQKIVRQGSYSFIGKMDYNLLENRNRNPLNYKENRTYRGKFYIASRLDFSFEEYDFENYIIAECDIVHYREMQAMKFTFKELKEIYKGDDYKFPQVFTLYKSIGLDFEPYKNVKADIFGGETIADK